MRNWLVILSLATLFSVSAQAGDCVILLHGLVRTDSSMSKLAAELAKQDFRVVNQRYPSRKYEIAKLADDAIGTALDACDGSQKIHFVTHSLGGILVRQYLTENEIATLGRVVMLGPPNKGSEVVDQMANVPGFALLNGPAGLQLGTGEMSVPNQLGAANFDLGIIAGTRSINLILSTMLPNPDDGKVSVENTKLEGMSDHIELPVTHPFMMRNDLVITQVMHYLQHGEFKRKES